MDTWCFIILPSSSPSDSTKTIIQFNYVKPSSTRIPILRYLFYKESLPTILAESERHFGEVRSTIAIESCKNHQDRATQKSQESYYFRLTYNKGSREKKKTLTYISTTRKTEKEI